MDRVPVFVGATKRKSLWVKHFFVSAEEGGANLKELAIFNGSSDVVISEFRPTGPGGCWTDIDVQPDMMRGLVGAKGFSFLKLLASMRVKTNYVTAPTRGRRRMTEAVFTEVRVVSPWQFAVVTSPGREEEAERVVLSVLRKHFRKTIVRVDWVFQ